MADVKWSQFPSVTPSNSDDVVGLHSGGNVLFSIANIVAAVRNGLANIFVPKTDVGAANGVASLDNTGKVPTSQLPSSTGPEPATATPLMDGTGAVGVSTKYAREDHEHPADTNKQAKITANGILKGDGQGGVSAATAGTDYQAPLTAGTDYATPAQLADKADKTDLSSIQATGTTNTTGSTIPARTYFYLNGVLVQSKTDILPNASFTNGTNYSPVTAGGLNDLANCFFSSILISTNFENGGWNRTDPGMTPTKNTIAIRARYTGGPLTQNAIYRILSPDSTMVGVLQLNSSGVVVADSGFHSGVYSFTPAANAVSFLLTLKYANDATITDLSLFKTTIMDFRYYV